MRCVTNEDVPSHTPQRNQSPVSSGSGSGSRYSRRSPSGLQKKDAIGASTISTTSPLSTSMTESGRMRSG